jgi:hypothetical protein
MTVTSTVTTVEAWHVLFHEPFQNDMSKAGHGIRILDTLKSDPGAFVAFYKYATKVMVLDSLNFLLEVNEYKSLPLFLRFHCESHLVFFTQP